MSRLWAIVRPSLVPGFHLGGIETHGAEDIETAEELVEKWMAEGEAGLLLIEDGFLARLDPGLVARLDRSDRQFHVAIPGGRPLGEEATRSARIARMIRHALGVRIDFRRPRAEVNNGPPG